MWLTVVVINRMLRCCFQNEIPTIQKLRKQLTKLTLDMDSVRTRCVLNVAWYIRRAQTLLISLKYVAPTLGCTKQLRNRVLENSFYYRVLII